MENTPKIEIDSLAVNLTKPSRQFGVPLIAFYSNCMICFLVGMVLMSVFHSGLITLTFLLLSFMIVHSLMILLTLNDAFGLQIFWVNFTKFRSHSNFKLWGNTDSFSP